MIDSFANSSATFDALNGWKDYPAEANRLREFISCHKRSPGRRLLDVSRGTAKHLELLQADFDVEGLDAISRDAGRGWSALPRRAVPPGRYDELRARPAV